MLILVYHYLEEGSSIGLYAKAAPLLNIFQTAAVLEVRLWFCKLKNKILKVKFFEL